MIESRAVAGRTGNRKHPDYAVSNIRFYIIFIAALLLIFQVWNQRRNSGIDEWLWMLLVAAIFVGVWLGSKKVRRANGAIRARWALPCWRWDWSERRP